jgi:PAS domain S-box-containing protein
MIQSCFRAGADDVLSLPIIKEEAAARVKIHLKVKQLSSWHKKTCNGLEQKIRDKSSELNLALKMLKKSDERLSMAITESPYPLAIHAEDGEMILISKSWVEISGYSYEEIPTINQWVKKAYGSDEEKALRLLKKLYTITNRVYQGEFRVLTKSGDERIWDFSSAPLGKLQDGRSIVLSIAVDVTERKQLMKELNRHRDHLGELVRDRTADLEKSRKAALNLMQDANIQRQRTETLMAELKESNHQVENLNKQIEFILGATKTGIDIIDADYNLLYIDPEWEKML